MKFNRFYIALAALGLVFCLSHPAKADPKPWVWSWGMGHFKNQTFQPYINDPRHPYNFQWDSQNWKPQDWVETTKNKEAMKLIRDFYFADILRDQDEKLGVPRLTVGPAFYQLGGQDKRRVLATVDSVYGVTTAHENGLFMVYDWYTHKPIGIYTRDGLQLQ